MQPPTESGRTAREEMAAGGGLRPRLPLARSLAARLRRAAQPVVVALLLAGSAAPALAQTARILLVGDSWVAQAWSARAFQTALQNKGLDEFEEVGGTTTLGGTTAAQWATAPYLQLVTDALAAHPDVDIVHLSMGGNDFLGAPPGTDVGLLSQQILADQQVVVDHILDLRPWARITIGTYDYTQNGALNAAQIWLAGQSIQATAQTPGWFTLNQLGVLHHVFGAAGLFGPGETPLPGNFPGYDPVGGGDPQVAGQPSQFRDTIHPTDAGYVALAEHAIDSYYAAWLLGAPLVPALSPWGIAALAVAFIGAGAIMLRGSPGRSRR